MAYKRILTVQDISCVGQCSMTVALPILSACGLETCILPSAVLSSHSGGFTGYTVRDLSDDMPRIGNHWKKEGITFDAIYTGYLGKVKEIGYMMDMIPALKAPGGRVIVDPAMADNGKLYAGLNEAYALGMRQLCAMADVILPNLTEACMMTDTPYPKCCGEDEIRLLMQRLWALGPKNIVITGIADRNDEIGIAVGTEGEVRVFRHSKVPKGYHGTGDMFASALVGAWMQGKPLYDAAKIAALYTSACIERTYREPAHWYGVRFEEGLADLIRAVKEPGKEVLG